MHIGQSLFDVVVEVVALSEMKYIGSTTASITWKTSHLKHTFLLLLMLLVHTPLLLA